MNKLVVEYKCVDSRGGGRRLGTHPDMWLKYDPRYETNIVTGIYADDAEGSGLYRSLVEHVPPGVHAGDRIWLVTVTYATVDTFHISYGNVTFPGAFWTQGDADFMKASILNGTYSEDNYTPWISGYFKSCERVDVTEWLVKG